MYENMKRYAVYWLLKAYYNWKIKNNQDFWILIAGTEGSGKSALAVHYAYSIDKGYLSNIKEQIIMSEEDIPGLLELLNRRAEQIEQGQEITPLVIHIDEGQLLWMSREANTRKNKQLDKILQTVRYMGICWIICTPSITNIGKELLRRIDWLVLAERYEHSIFLRDLGDYMGRLYYLEARLTDIKQKSAILQPKINQIIKTTGLYPDIIAKTPYYTDIYKKYEPIKHKKTAEFVKSLKSNSLKSNAASKGPTLSAPPKPKMPVEPGGTGELCDYAKIVAFAENYYTYSALSKILGVSVSYLKRKVPEGGVPYVQQGRKKYYKLKEVMSIL